MGFQEMNITAVHLPPSEEKQNRNTAKLRKDTKNALLNIEESTICRVAGANRADSPGWGLRKKAASPHME